MGTRSGNCRCFGKCFEQAIGGRQSTPSVILHGGYQRVNAYRPIEVGNVRFNAILVEFGTMGNNITVYLMAFPIMRLSLANVTCVKAYRRGACFNVDSFVFNANGEEVQVHHRCNEMRAAHRRALLLNVASCPEAHMLGKNECAVLDEAIEIVLRFQQIPTRFGKPGERIPLDIRSEPGRFPPHHLASSKPRFKRRVHERYRSSSRPALSDSTSRKARVLTRPFAHATASSTSSSTASPWLCSL